MFYANLTYKDDTISSKVKKHLITLFIKYFAQVCNLPFIQQDYDQTCLEGNDFSFDIYAHTLLIDLY